MLTITATEFKATLHSVIRRIQKTGEPVTITKYGRPFFVISPPPMGDEVQGHGLAMDEDRLTTSGGVFSPLDLRDS